MTASPAPHPAFEREWRALAARRGWQSEVGERWLADLTARHAEPHRHYHSVSHIVDLLVRIAALPFADRSAAVAAAFWHDAIYEVGVRDNEARSADLARAALNELDAKPFAARVAAICAATATHTATGDADTDLFLDADMAVLGDAPDAYDRYREAVMAEHLTAVPREAYLSGRIALFIEPTLAGGPIFHTPSLAPREAQARENLAREGKWLRAGAP